MSIFKWIKKLACIQAQIVLIHLKLYSQTQRKIPNARKRYPAVLYIAKSTVGGKGENSHVHPHANINYRRQSHYISRAVGDIRQILFILRA